METQHLYSNKEEFLEGLLLIKPDIYKDERGFFIETWNEANFNSLVSQKINFVQDNFSLSIKNVIRGLHFQLNPFDQGKLVRCSHGKIFDVAVDVRSKSKTFGQWAGVILDDKSHKQFWIPTGYAHGFLVLSDSARVNYKTNNFYSKKHESSIRWDDPNIGIEWPCMKIKPLLSEKDLNAKYLNEAKIFE